MSGDEEFISIVGRAMLVFTAVEVIRLVTAGAAAAVFFEGFTLCSAGGAGGGAVNLSFSLRAWTTWTTRNAATPMTTM